MIEKQCIKMEKMEVKPSYLKRCIIIQSPLVQLNTPYPSGAYLKSFFSNYNERISCDLYNNHDAGTFRGGNYNRESGNSRGGHFSSVKWIDASNLLFHRIFSPEGLRHIFDSTENKALKMANEAEKNKNDDGVGEATAYNLRRYLMQKDAWISWIDRIKAILGCETFSDGSEFSGRRKISGRELCHEFIYSPFAPRGSRMENYLADLEQNFGRQPTIDDARFLASFALADLSDYITAIYDSNFSLIRYAEHLATSEKDFSKFERALESPILKDFLEPLISEINKDIKDDKDDKDKIPAGADDKHTLFCISVPFAGCFAPALSICRTLRSDYGDKAIISLGGGYINTELRGIQEKKLFDYVDFISYDRGYGSYIDLINSDFARDGREYYKTAYLHDGKIINTADRDKANKDEKDIKDKQDAIAVLEEKCTLATFPDYSDIDFSLYPRLADDANPMHRIWSDGSWLKAYMAHGCYWHKCAFCDTTLDYVCSYKRLDCKKLYAHLSEQARKTGIYGIHFVDEACPPRSLVEFASENTTVPSTKSQGRLTFWGNIRFEKSFTRDIADFLSYGGLIGVSGGIEIATGSGLEKVNKGTDLESLIGACCAFKEAGILVHAYMIYGFYSESTQDTINSMEVLRQMFEAGLLDGSFWHKFVLTKHSTLFTEWKEGKHPDLKPILDIDVSDADNKHKPWFAQNDIHFEGEEKYEKFDYGLNLALNDWMHGENLTRPVQTWFNFPVPKPSIPRDYIEHFINKYEEKKNREHNDFSSFCTDTTPYRWIGGKVISDDRKIMWHYFGQLVEMNMNDVNCAKKIATSLNDDNLRELCGHLSAKQYRKLRENGLVKIC